jgi:hypothetical protein
MIDPSREPETNCFILGLNTTLVTASLWPRNDRSSVGSSAIFRSAKGSTDEFSAISGRLGVRFSMIIDQRYECDERQ